MFKITPNPPETDSTSTHSGRKNKKHDETTKRVLDHYLLPKPEKSEEASNPDQLFTVKKTPTTNACSPTSAKIWHPPTR